MREFSRTSRVADFVKRETIKLLQFSLRDPRVGMVSITDVEVSRDLSHARVFVTVMDCETEQEAAETLKVLNGAAGFLRSELARSSTARTTPRLKFIFDSSIGRGQHLSRLIDTAVTTDRNNADSDSSTDTDGGE